MPRFVTYAARRAADPAELFDRVPATPARAWNDAAEFGARTQSYVGFRTNSTEVSSGASFAGTDPAGPPTPLGAKAAGGADSPLLTGLFDAHGDDIQGAGSITVDGAHIVASIDALGDQDFFAVNLVEGQWYNIGQYLKLAGPTLIPLADAYLELYDAGGALVATADGGGPNTPSGLDALLTFQAEYTGTYYINARAYDQDATLNGATGDFVGDYELFVDTTNIEANPYAYRPFYDTDSPLHSLDWGSQVDRTSRNPDGNNGTRPNPWAPDGNGPILTNNYGIEGKNVITYYFAKQGDLFIDEDPLNPGLATMLQARNMEAWEKEAFRKALDLYEQVADVIYIEVDSRAEADFKFITYQGTPGVGASLLGRMSPPNELNEGQTEFNAGDVRWTEAGLQQGGFYFPTLVHELGHGHGLAHPHDNGGRSSVMPGADGGTGGLGGGYGDWGLSQQVFTIMSYNDGWAADAPYNAAPAGHGGPRSGGLTGLEVDHFGWQGTLAALDIAVLQDKYGVNEEWATGDDLYEIKDFNGAGNFYATIWDGGGVDEIRYGGSADAIIDLRAATLRYEEGGGGRLSYAYGLWGGFTIANGVTIENATGGSGDDTLNGNEAGNVLVGAAGADVLQGFGGDDFLLGGGQADQLDGGEGADVLNGGGGADEMAGGRGDDTYHVDHAGDLVLETPGEGVDVILASVSFDLAAEVEDITFRGTADADSNGNGGANRMLGNEARNRLEGRAGDDVLMGRGGDDILYGQTGDDTVLGGAGADRMTGGAGHDLLDGGAGDDRLTGGDGRDVFVFTGAFGRDVVVDFSTADDTIRLDAARFADFSDVLAHAADTAGGVVISKGGVSLTLQGVSRAQLSAGDFEFVGPASASRSGGAGAGPLILPADPVLEDDLEPVEVRSEPKISLDDPAVCPTPDPFGFGGDSFGPGVAPVRVGAPSAPAEWFLAL